MPDFPYTSLPRLENSILLKSMCQLDETIEENHQNRGDFSGSGSWQKTLRPWKSQLIWAAQILEVFFPWGFNHQKEVILIGKSGGMIWGYHRDIKSTPILYCWQPPFCMVPVRCGFIHCIHHVEWCFMSSGEGILTQNFGSYGRLRWQLPAAPWLSKE